jgi:DNA polymerase-3 subunit beta
MNNQFFIKQSTLDAMLLLAGKKDIRYYLNGLYIEYAPAFTRVVGCDGHKLGVYQAAAENTGSGSIIIPRDVIENLPKGNKEFLLGFTQLETGNQWQIITGAASVNFAPCEGTYPDFRRVTHGIKTTGEAGGFNVEYLNQFEKCGNLLAGSKSKAGNRVRIHHNGTSGAMIVFNGVDNFAGVVMPLRDSVGSSGATFPADLISAIEPAAEHETAAAVKNIQIVKAA